MHCPFCGTEQPEAIDCVRCGHPLAGKAPMREEIPQGQQSPILKFWLVLVIAALAVGGWFYWHGWSPSASKAMQNIKRNVR